MDFDLLVPLASLGPANQDIYCSIQTVVYNGALLETLIQIGGDVYQSVNLEWEFSTGCDSCNCSTADSQAAVETYCPSGFSVSVTGQCAMSANCPSGSSLTAIGCKLQSSGLYQQPSCPYGSVLVSQPYPVPTCTQNPISYCPVGWMLNNNLQSCVIVCPVSNHIYVQVDGTCILEIPCPSGFVFNSSQPLRSLCSAADHCAGEPCQNGGTCVDTGVTFSCSCSSGWTGSDCSSVGSTASAKSGPSSSSSSIIPVIGGIVGGALVCVILFLAALFVIRRRRKNRPGPASNSKSHLQSDHMSRVCHLIALLLSILILI